VRVVDIREHSLPISRFADPALPTGGLTTSAVSVTTDARRDGAPVVGYGFGSFGRYAQSGLIRERFAPRLLAAGGGLDPLLAWEAMMAGEKPGGHGERCVAVGALDMALWDAAAKAAGLPLHRHLADVLPQARPQKDVAVYAAGGYRYPGDDLKRLR
jgi:L-alanine-DL-glutamate epimerase-like enolase superfamily enzyme